MRYICKVKILIVRFSSIGDIVLTSPVVRALKEQLPDVELHYLTKERFAGIVESNPHLSKIHTIDRSIQEILPVLKAENFDCLIDLHHNVRTLSLKKKLGCKAYSFQKLNWKKWLLVRFKIHRMPQMHVVDRYFGAVKALGVKADQLPGNYFIPSDQEVDVQQEFGLAPEGYIALAIGAQFATKRMPAELLVEIIKGSKQPVVLVGGKEDSVMAASVLAHFSSSVFDACGKYSLAQSASIVRQSAKVVTNDTGMMHIAACFDRQIISVWGNTVPSFGMFPYYPSTPEKFSIHEVKDLSCRPCSKIGHASCPKGHFKCMKEQDVQAIVEQLDIH